MVTPLTVRENGCSWSNRYKVPPGCGIGLILAAEKVWLSSVSVPMTNCLIQSKYY
jgi:hypothetical protein